MKYMKRLFFFCFIVLAMKSKGQVIADPAHSQIDLINLANSTQDPTTVPLDGVIQLRVPILNLNSANNLPSGTCKIKIGLGSKLVLDPSFNLGNTNTSAYFNWTATSDGGQVQLTGELVNPVPANYSTTGIFRVKGSLQGNSTITTNFLVTNHNTAVNLSDENPNNNTSFLPYTVVPVIPVTFTGIAVKKEGCSIMVNFSAENEINTDHYEIEASKDGIHYFTAGQTTADHRVNYAYSFYLSDNIKAEVLKVRVKSVDKDGRLMYTEIRTVKGTCDGKLLINLYPNPVSKDNGSVSINAAEGIFNGRFNISLSDIRGRLLRTGMLQLVNQKQFSYTTGLLPAGQYLIRLQENDGGEPITLKFQKL